MVTIWICQTSCTNYVFHILCKVVTKLDVSIQDLLMLAIPNYACNQFPHNFWSLYEYLIHYHSVDSLVKGSYRFHVDHELRMVSKVQSGCPITFNIMSNICVRLR